jgi:hypothetical protein
MKPQNLAKLIIGAGLALAAPKIAKADNLCLGAYLKEPGLEGGYVVYSNDNACISAESYNTNNEKDIGIRIPIKGNVSGYTSLYGTNTDSFNFIGNDSSLKKGNLVFGHTLERKIPETGANTDLISGFIGYNNGNQAAKLQLSNISGIPRQDFMAWTDLTRNEKGGNLVGFAYRNQEDKELARFIFEHYTNKKGEGAGHRTYIQADKQGNWCFDTMIVPRGNNFTRASATALVDNLNSYGGPFDPSLNYSTFDASTTYLSERGKTSFEIKAVGNKGQDVVPTIGIAQNIGKLGLSYHYTFPNNGNKSSNEITGILNLPNGLKVRVTKLNNNKLESMISFSKSF